MATSKAAGALAGAATLVTTSGSMPGYKATKSGNLGISQRTANEGLTLILTVLAGARAITARAAVPICASCKQIRDDEGYWHQVEKYVQDHSHAQFSHSLCPDCIKKLYPELPSNQAAKN